MLRDPTRGYPPGWGYPSPPRTPAVSGLAVLVLVTILAALAAPHAKAVRAALAEGPRLPRLDLPDLPRPAPASPARPRSPRGLTFTSSHGCQPARDWRSGQLDRRVRTLLTAAAGRAPIRVSCLRSGHSHYVKGTTRVSNHIVWRAADIDMVGGRPVGPANAAARQLAAWIGHGGAGVQPSEVGSPWRFGGRPWFTDAGHQGHLHIGFAGPTRPGAA